jgi:hypothetical protein
MDLQEQRLIEDLFARLKSVSAAEKDEDAGRLIRDLISRFPDAPYYLTQSVLVQQQALDRADARIKELEELAQQKRVSEPRGSTSFLGGSSVPQTGRRYADAPSEPERPSASPWTPSSSPSRSGGFLASALSTATGVAGGMFLADSIRSLFGGGASQSGSALAADKQAALDRAQDDAQDAEDDAQQAHKDLAADDAALDDMQDEQDDDDGWSDDDDGSLDI